MLNFQLRLLNKRKAHNLIVHARKSKKSIMQGLQLRFPDDSLSCVIDRAIELGRGEPPCLTDPTCSRKQFRLIPTSSSKDTLTLEALGVNPVCIESLNSVPLQKQPAKENIGRPLITSSTPQCAQISNNTSWQLVGFLEQGQSLTVTAGMRFYLLDRSATTTIAVVSATTGAAASQPNKSVPFNSDPDPDPRQSGPISLLQDTILAQTGMHDRLRHLTPTLRSVEVMGGAPPADPPSKVLRRHVHPGSNKSTSPEVEGTAPGVLSSEGLAEGGISTGNIVKKKRGRPAKAPQSTDFVDMASSSLNLDLVDVASSSPCIEIAPEEIGASASSRSSGDTLKRKRGRPPKHSNSPEVLQIDPPCQDIMQVAEISGCAPHAKQVDIQKLHRSNQKLHRSNQKLHRSNPLSSSDSLAEAAAVYEGTSSPAVQSTQQNVNSYGTTDRSNCSAAFSLMKVRGLSERSNTGCLGVHLSDLVVGPIKMAVVSNMMVDMAWLLDACPALIASQEMVVVHGGSGQAVDHMQETLAFAGILDRCTIHAPPLPISYGTHHSKFMILWYDRPVTARGMHATDDSRDYPGGIRVIVHTANYIHSDCTNKTQGIWWQDFPVMHANVSGEPSMASSSSNNNRGRRTSTEALSSASQGPARGEFGLALERYLSKLKLPGKLFERVRSVLQGHDFSSARAHLVPSVPGYFVGQDLDLYGHMRVRSVLSNIPLGPSFSNEPAGPQLVAQCSSLGSLDEKWLLQEFGCSLAQQQQQQAASTSSSGIKVLQPVTLPKESFSIVWPTVDQVKNSNEGWTAGLSIPGSSKNVMKPFLKSMWCRFRGDLVGRGRAMPHMKSYLRYRDGEAAWVMIGSHNLSKAAWGMLVKGGGTLMVRSYELSVLLTPYLEVEYREHAHRGFQAAPLLGEAAAGWSSTLDLNRWYQKAVEKKSGMSMKAEQTRILNEGESKKVVDDSNQVAARKMLIDFRAYGQDVEMGVTPEAVACLQDSVLLPLPFNLPPDRYRPNPRQQPFECGSSESAEDIDEPWTVDTPYSGLDAVGRQCGQPSWIDL
ncbi:hypothetical protein CEUSTIGMA_g11554.t1 [Chlamydomonas eustigma]|uniref:PLD phosphodiesterase domain-containing protein n=1 Tax=Chlamydomonas eustigma TaxID=1157962 RepID=A0A250XM15_9CHLO|nr:hypothetical protein CEUSTIGMA_g11554.t1 [Chlamydomonas eustigma]|eukprot:GAX84131.1 hypothetical protein CEUSTIGMA_g11554.t1 [Chlamydomonas eustigma]